jgi:acetolactate decarboxylase
MRTTSTYLIVLLLISCNPKETAPMEVKVSGALMEIMHQGKIGATIQLDTLNATNLYGLGALDSLKGEVMVLNEQSFVSTVKNDSLLMSQSISIKASLFVYSYVSTWDTLNIYSFDDMATLVMAQIKERNQQEPLPFILIGSPALVKYHVINFDPEVSDISNHKEGAYIGELDNEPITLLGFYATAAQGIYTHHDSNVHMHMMNETNSVMGHVDTLESGNEMIYLLLPSRETRN